MLQLARRVIEEEAKGLALLANNMPIDFDRLAARILALEGRVILSGIGKSGYVARKIAASFASTGTAAFYLHPAEASHGDLGMITEKDLVILLSNSGETKEIFDIINYCKRFGIEIAGMTMKPESTLGASASYLLNLPVSPEASVIDAPTTSTLMMLALGDALMVYVYENKGFTKEDFRLFHPGGKIGANLLKVSDIMHKEAELPIVYENDSMSEVLIVMTKRGFGCAVVLSKEDKVIGFISDGDLRRHMHDGLLVMLASEIMTRDPKSISSKMLASEALSILNKFSITSLLVLDDGRLAGILHIHDILRAGVG